MSVNEEAISILSLDAGGSGAFSQLVILHEYMRRLAYDLNKGEDDIFPCDHFDLMAGVGTGGLIAIMLGCLCMTVPEVINEFEALSHTVFAPLSVSDAWRFVLYDINKLEEAITDLVRRRGMDPTVQMADFAKTFANRARVMVGASPEHLVSYFQPMKSYKGRQPPFQCTIVEAAVATMATPGLFEPFSIGTFPYKQKYIGAGTVYGNPGERILREAREVYGYECRISIILSIGSGSRPNLSQEKAVASIGSANILSHIAFHSDITAKSLEFQLSNVDGYLRISVPAPLWSENDWANLGQIASDTEDYLARERETSTAMDLSIDTLRERRTSITIGQLSNYGIMTTYSSAKAVPDVSPYFVPREKAWERMKECLLDDSIPRRKVFVLHGMGGCGKTQLVAYFVQEYHSRYDHILFVEATSKSTIRADIQAAIRSFGVAHRQKIMEAGLSMLAHEITSWLLIFDNADHVDVALRSYFPDTNTHGTIIVTTRCPEHVHLANDGYAWELGEMTMDEARDTLHKASRRTTPFSPSENMEAEQLAEALGYLAVALVQAASYCYIMSSTNNGLPGIYTFGKYLELMHSNRSRMMKRDPSITLDRYDKGAYTTLDISYPKLENGAQDLLRLSSFFHGSDIPLVILSTALESDFTDVQQYLARPSDHARFADELRRILSLNGEWNEDHINRFVMNLRSFSLVTTTQHGATVSLRYHPLVHAWARDSLDRRDVTRFGRMTTVILSSCIASENTPIRGMILPHVLELLEAKNTVSTFPELHVNDKAAFATLLLEHGKRSEATVLWEEVHTKIKETSPEGGNDDMAIEAAVHLALAYCEQHDWVGALSLQKEVLDVRTRRFGETDQRVIKARMDLAQTFRGQADWQTAEHEMEVVVEALQQIQQPDGREASSSNGTPRVKLDDALETLMRIYEDQSKWTSVLQRAEELVPLRRRRYGNDNWRTFEAEAKLRKAKEKLGIS